MKESAFEIKINDYFIKNLGQRRIKAMPINNNLPKSFHIIKDNIMDMTLQEVKIGMLFYSDFKYLISKCITLANVSD